mmetsp:Transcript_57226/g.94614  ORF Transcript_57226/g.94614 Transcript_57226/m.94614 type:complete len:300 (-) Transcript_57226:309-1208(-)
MAKRSCSVDQLNPRLGYQCPRPRPPAPQPHFSFEVVVDTLWGDTVLLVGSSPQLGTWDCTKGVRLATDASTYPTWHVENIKVSPAVGQHIEYKFVILRANGGVCEWEQRDNRQLKVQESSVDGLVIRTTWCSPNEQCCRIPTSRPELEPPRVALPVSRDTMVEAHLDHKPSVATGSREDPPGSFVAMRAKPESPFDLRAPPPVNGSFSVLGNAISDATATLLPFPISDRLIPAARSRSHESGAENRASESAAAAAHEVLRQAVAHMHRENVNVGEPLSPIVSLDLSSIQASTWPKDLVQ